MSFNLFEDDQAVAPLQQQVSALELDHTSATAIAEEPELSLVETVAKQYQDGLDEAIRIIDLMNGATTFFGEGFSPLDDSKRKLPDIDELHRSIFNAIVCKAKVTGLAEPGDYGFEESFDAYITGPGERERRYGDETPVRTNILGLCKAINAEYGGVGGQKAEFRRIAKNIISTFDLGKTKIVVKAGFVDLSQRTYLQTNFRGQYEWDFSRRRCYLGVLNDLKAIFEKSNMHFGLGAFYGALRADRDITIEPNKTKFEGFINDYPVRVLVRKEEMRWRFAPECIDVISDFATEFGPEVSPDDVQKSRR